MATPTLRALRGQFPGTRIVYACRPYVRPLLDGLSWHDDLLLESGGSLAFLRLVRGMRHAGCDTALLLASSFGSAAACLAAGIPRRVGYAVHGRGWLLTDPLLPLRDAGGRAIPDYMGRLYVRLAEGIGCAVGDRRMALATTPREEAAAEALWERHGLKDRPVVGLVPGAAYGSAKCWPPGHFAALARAVRAETGTPALLLVGPGEEAIAEGVRKGAGEDALRLAGPGEIDLGALKAAVRRLAVAVTNDTGPRHVAEALGVPTVALLGPMDPRYTDSGNPAVTVLREPVDCAPCNKRTCPIDHRCLVRITPERVMAAVREHLCKQDPRHVS
jgi:heptosyltransferase-2